MIEIIIQRVISVSKPQTLKFYTVQVVEMDKKGKIKPVLDEKGNVKREPVVCLNCKKPIKKNAKIRTAEVIATFKLGKIAKTRTAHLPLCDACKL